MITQALLESVPLITEGIPTESLTEEQLRSVLAYELWKDGCDDFDHLEEVVLGTSVQFKNNKEYICYLKAVFGRE